MQNQKHIHAIEALQRQHEMNKPNIMGIVGFIMSIVALITVWISVFSFISIIFIFVSILHMILLISALIISIIGLRKPKKGFAISGLIISILVIFIYLFLVLGSASIMESLVVDSLSQS